MKPRLTPITVLSVASALLPLTIAEVVHAETTQEIVISASRVDLPREASGSSITVLDEAYLERNQIRVISDALRDIPGVAVNQQSGFGSKTQIRIRGAEANQTLVLIDGIEVNDIGADSEFDFAHLLNLEIERVEVLRGAQSALWGSDAMGGVINIITKKGEGPLKASATIETGSFDTQQQNVSLSGGNDQAHFSLSAGLLESDGFSSLNENRGYTEKDGYHNRSLNFKGGFKASDNLAFNLVVRNLDAKTDIDSFVFAVGSVDDESYSESEQTFARISADLDLLDGQWQHLLAYSQGNTDYEIFGTSPYATRGGKDKLEYQSDYFFTANDIDQRVSFVAEHEKESFYSSYLASSDDHEVDSTGLVLEYGLNFDDQYYLTVAGRHDVNDIFKNANTYHIGFSGWATDALRLHASTGTGIKNPTLIELFGTTASYTGNADLLPEENKTWDLGAEYHFDNIDGYVDVTIFHSDVKNKITGFGSTSNNEDSNVTIKGLELTAAFQPTEQIDLNASYTFTRTDDGTGTKLIRVPTHIASLNGSYLFTNGKTRLSGGVQYNGSQDDWEFDPFYNRTTVKLSSYTLANVTLSHEYSNQFQVFGRIENLLDDEYEEIINYGTADLAVMVGIKLTGNL